jgi:hypothetical protein
MLRRAVVLLLSLLAADVAAQQVTLTVSDAGSLMQDATLDDYAQGYIIGLTPVTYTVTLSGNQGVCATVQLKGATAAGSDHGLSDVRWGLTAANQTTTLATTAATVRSHLLTTTSTSTRTATGVIYFRTINLSWGDGPKTYLGPDLIFDVSARRASSC